jgi:hypothetical protein
MMQQLNQAAAHRNLPPGALTSLPVADDDPVTPIDGARVITVGGARPTSAWRRSVNASCEATGRPSA